jgi:hypothetical protein
MKETFIDFGRRRFAVLLALIGAAFLCATFLAPDVFHLARKEAGGLSRVLFISFALFSGCYLGLEAFVKRIEATDTGLTFFDRLNRRTLELPYSQIAGYRATKAGAWQFFVEEKVHALYEIDFGKMHRIMRKMAPRALSAKRWRSGQMPPAEDFRNLNPFDMRSFLVDIVATCVCGLPLFILMGPKGFLYLFGVMFLPSLYDLKDLLIRFAVTSEGVREERPRSTRKIAWGEITAVFCNGGPSSRTFTVVSQTTSITFTRPIAQDLDVMRKFFYTLPEGTPCVNFDESIRTGYRPRRRRRSARGPVVTEPILQGF